jgi:hypothetical protein
MPPAVSGRRLTDASSGFSRQGRAFDKQIIKGSLGLRLSKIQLLGQVGGHFGIFTQWKPLASSIQPSPAGQHCSQSSRHDVIPPFLRFPQYLIRVKSMAASCDYLSAASHR